MRLGEKVIFQNGVNGPNSIFPDNLFSFLVSAAIVPNADFVNAAARALASLAVISGSNPKRSSQI